MRKTMVIGIAVAGMLLDAWEAQGERDGHEVEALILTTGEVLSPKRASRAAQ